MSHRPTLSPAANPEREPSVVKPCARVDGQSYKALLIGIRGKGTASEEYELTGPHKDVEDVQALLIDCYDYHAADITTLIDDGVAAHVQPTRANILKAISDLVKDAKAGDHICFHYSGHSMQTPNHSNSEEGGKDGCLIPSDGERIMDNELNAALVLPLPVGCQLVAVLDTCYSGSLLDLKHWWTSRYGKRGSDGIKRRVVRSNARMVSRTASILPAIGPSPTRLLARPSEINMNLMYHPSPLHTASSSLGRHASGDAARGSGLGPQRTFTYRASTASLVPPSEEDDRGAVMRNESDDVFSPLRGKFWVLPEGPQRCASPVAMFGCTGWRREPDRAAVKAEPSSGGVRADVISLAACMDHELSYEDEDGYSMTSSLVEILRRKPCQSLNDVLLSLSYAIHTKAAIRHENGKNFEKELKDYKAIIEKVEKKNAQDHRTMSLVIPEAPPPFPSSLVIPRIPPPLPSSPTFPVPRTSFWGRRAEQLKMLLKMKQLVFDSKVLKYPKVDLDHVQNPQLSSAKPLNMEWHFRM
ncbi:caspase domain-containing protein [Mycena haematopus]|nr:caspase domain-containing protein [Mycena haematopus]